MWNVIRNEPVSALNLLLNVIMVSLLLWHIYRWHAVLDATGFSSRLQAWKRQRDAAAEHLVNKEKGE